MDGAGFVGYVLGALLLNGVIPIVIGGFYPKGYRATAGRAIAGWAAAIGMSFLSWNGGGNLAALFIVLAFVLLAFSVNRSLPPKEK